MTIRLLAVSTAANTDAALQELLRQAGPEVELVLHLGNTESDYKASAVSRMNLRRGRRGHLTQDTRFTGLAHALFMQEDYEERVDEFIDHLHRRHVCAFGLGGGRSRLRGEPVGDLPLQLFVARELQAISGRRAELLR